MKLSITNVKFFIAALNAIENVDYECTLTLSETGIRIKGIDPSRIALFDFCMGTVKDGVDFGIHLMDVNKILTRLKASSEIIFDVDTLENSIKIIGRIKNRKKTFTLREMDIEVEDVNIEKFISLPYKHIFSMPTEELVEILEDMFIMSMRVNLGIRKKKLIFTSYSTIGSSLIERDGEYDFPNFGSSYSIPLILSKIKELKGFDVDLIVGSDLPIYLSYDLDDAYMKIFVAPLVEQDEWGDQW